MKEDWTQKLLLICYGHLLKTPVEKSQNFGYVPVLHHSTFHRDVE